MPEKSARGLMAICGVAQPEKAAIEAAIKNKERAFGIFIIFPSKDEDA